MASNVYDEDLSMTEVDDMDYYADYDEITPDDSDGEGFGGQPSEPRDLPVPRPTYDSEDEDGGFVNDNREQQDQEMINEDEDEDDDDNFSQYPTTNPPPNRSYYGDDSDDDLNVLTSVESEGDGRDPWSEEIKHKDDDADSVELQHIKSYYQGLVGTGLGRAVPLIYFPITLERAGYGNTPLNGPWEGDLTNDIHPVLQMKNWIREPHWDENSVLWQRLQPSLKLATKFISNKHLQGWWIRALLGHQVKDKKTRRWYMSDPGVSGAAEMRKVASKWEYLIKHVRLSFSHIMDAGMGHQTHGMTTRNTFYLDRVSYLPPGGYPRHRAYPQEICVGLHRNFRRFLMSKDYEADGNLCNRMRTNWVLAVTIAHELAHAFYVSKAGIGSSFDEPYFDLHDNAAEIGWSWERFMWGPGEFQCFIDLNVGVIGLHWGPRFVAPRDPAVQHDSLLKFAVSPHWMHKFFLEATWETFEMATPEEKGVFWKPPQDGTAVTHGPALRNSNTFQTLLLFDEYPDDDRRSITYWWIKSQELLKREIFKAKTKKARKKTAKQDKVYRGRIHKNFVPPRNAAGYDLALRPNPAWTNRFG